MTGKLCLEPKHQKILEESRIRYLYVIDLETDYSRTSAASIQILVWDTFENTIRPVILVNQNLIKPNKAYDKIADIIYFKTEKQALDHFANLLIPEELRNMLKTRDEVMLSQEERQELFQRVSYNIHDKYLHEKACIISHNGVKFDFALLHAMAARSLWESRYMKFRRTWVGKAVRESWTMPVLKDEKIEWSHCIDTLALAKLLRLKTSLRDLEKQCGAKIKKKDFDIVSYLLKLNKGKATVKDTKSMLQYGIQDCKTTADIFLRLITDYCGELVKYIRENFEKHSDYGTCPLTPMEILEEAERGSGSLANLVLESLISYEDFSAQQAACHLSPSVYMGGNVGFTKIGRHTAGDDDN